MRLSRLISSHFSYSRKGKTSLFPGNFSRVKISGQTFCYVDYFTGYHDYSLETLPYFKNKVSNRDVRKEFNPFHLPTYLFFNYIGVRTVFSPYPINISILAAGLTSINLYPFFFRDSDSFVLLETFEIIGPLFEKHRLFGFSPNFDHMYLDYYGRDRLLRGSYNLHNGNIYSEQIYIDLFNKYFNPLYNALCNLPRVITDDKYNY
jgi:hypothetical protein